MVKAETVETKNTNPEILNKYLILLFGIVAVL
jgi:hypothetical protein